MRIMVVGSGGREHAICRSLVESRERPRLFCTPGNAGIREFADCFDVMADDIEDLEIEGISIGDSLLLYSTDQEIKKKMITDYH